MKKIVLIFSAICLVGLTNCKQEKPSELVNDTVADASTTNNITSDIKADNLTKPNESETSTNEDIDPATAPEIAFKELTHDFGNIPYGTKVSHNFEFTNTGKSPLVIKSVKPSCGCTVPAKPEAPIAPGESGTITVEFNPKNYNGKQGSSVTVQTNTVKETEILRISAQVENAPGKPKTNNTPKAPTALAAPAEKTNS